MRLTTKIAIGVLTPIVAYFGYDSLMGHWLVHRLCAKDGGLRIHETVFAKGYLDESVADELYCQSCIGHLAKREFEYVDVHVPGDPATAHPLAIRPGYYRYTLTSRGDPRCDVWAKNVNLQRWADALRRAGGAPDHCVAVEALPGRPAGAVLTESREPVAEAFAVDVRMHRYTVNDAQSARVMAEVRNYLFYAAPDRWFNFAGGDVPEPAAMCGDHRTRADAMKRLFTDVIRIQGTVHEQFDTGSVR